MTTRDSSGGVASTAASSHEAPGSPGTLVLELLDWVAREPRSHRETIETWGSHCPRITPWEDALESGLVRVTRNRETSGRLTVVLTRSGQAALAVARSTQPPGMAWRPGGQYPGVFLEEFDGPGLDTSIWLPHYLPAWSSRAETAAAYEVADSCLRLFIPPEQGLWMGAEHEPSLRASGVQTGNFSGPVGSGTGQQPLPGGSIVREEQPRFEGFLPRFGELSMRARMTVSSRSMAAWWMVGFEDRPERSAEICVFEVFGDTVQPGSSAAVGMGLHPFRDPRITDDFAAVPLPLDVSEWHDYAVRWTPAEAVFSVDGAEVRSCRHPPDYPMQMMVAVFDFPERSDGSDAHLVPELLVDRLSWSPLPGAG